jgi:dihydrofolate reductase
MKERETMGKVRASAFSVSLDGFGAGPNQDLQHPFGVGGMELPNWLLKTRMFHEMIGQPGGTTDTDDAFARKSMENVGAWIMGRNMFGPIRGQWPDHSWKGWWGPNPPYHVPVFVLTHHPRPPLEMEGGTVFHFVTDGIEAALERASPLSGNICRQACSTNSVWPFRRSFWGKARTCSRGSTCRRWALSAPKASPARTRPTSPYCDGRRNVCAGATLTLNVVPAHMRNCASGAGTHNHRPRSLCKASATSPSLMDHAVWVPAQGRDDGGDVRLTDKTVRCI